MQAQEIEKEWLQKDVLMQWESFSENHSLTEWMLRGWNIITQACLFRKDFINKANPWNEQLITHEDYLYLFKLSLLNPICVHVPDETVIYRQHGQQSTDNQTISKTRAQDKMEVLSEIRTLLSSTNADWVSKGLFLGRLAKNYSFLGKSGVDQRRYSGFISPTDYLWTFIYRFYNNRKRKATGTNWEPMHGISSSESDFKKVINSIVNE